jgi:hypothetical protein
MLKKQDVPLSVHPVFSAFGAVHDVFIVSAVASLCTFPIMKRDFISASPSITAYLWLPLGITIYHDENARHKKHISSKNIRRLLSQTSHE